MFTRIRWRIALPYVLLIALAMGVLAGQLLGVVRDTYLQELEHRLSSSADLIADDLVDATDSSDMAELILAAKTYGEQLNVRVTVIDLTGKVLADTYRDPGEMDNHLFRPEVQAVLADRGESNTRYSDTVGYQMLYVARPMMRGEMVVGIVRLAVPLSDIDAAIASLRGNTNLGIWIAAIGAILLAIVVAESTTRPIGNLRRVVERMAQGDLQARLVPSTKDEISNLTHSFNSMASRLQDTVLSLDREREQLAAVLEHMADGVLIVDDGGQVTLMNPAARRILRTRGRGVAPMLSLSEVVRQHEIIAVWDTAMEDRVEQVDVVEVEREGVFLQVVVTPLADREGSALMILQDLGHVRRLETVRREFVSNISHELRTPLASLKALADTLRDGALDDKKAARRFLGRIEQEVDTLSQMTEELLELSRIESGRVPIRLLPVELVDFILPPLETLQPQADRAGLYLSVDMPSDLPMVLGDVTRLRQVVTNLVHNAIKFTPEGGRIVLGVREGDDDSVVISVQDTGIGISKDMLPRIFERFFKGDRSRSQGGTGLGLAIAKHMVQAHGGRIWAESTEGEGSTFYFSLLSAQDRGFGTH